MPRRRATTLEHYWGKKICGTRDGTKEETTSLPVTKSSVTTEMQTDPLEEECKLNPAPRAVDVGQRRRNVESWQAGMGEKRDAGWTTRVLFNRLGRLDRSFLLSVNQRVTCVSLDRMGALLAAGSTDGLHLFELDDNFCSTPMLFFGIRGSVSGIAWSEVDDGELSVCFSHSSDVAVIDLREALEAAARDLRPPLKRILRSCDRGHMAAVYLSVGGEELLVCCSSQSARIRAWAGSVRRWDIEVGSTAIAVGLARFEGLSLLAAATTDHVRLWDASVGEVRTFRSVKEPRRLWCHPIHFIAPDAYSCGAIQCCRAAGRRFLVVAARCRAHTSVYLVDADHARPVSVFNVSTTRPLLLAPFCSRAFADSCAFICSSETETSAFSPDAQVPVAAAKIDVFRLHRPSKLGDPPCPETEAAANASAHRCQVIASDARREYDYATLSHVSRAASISTNILLHWRRIHTLVTLSSRFLSREFARRAVPIP